MSRPLVKLFFAGCISFAGIFGISAACSISPAAGRQYTFADDNCNVPPAIFTVKRVVDSGDFFQEFMKERDKDIRYMAVPTNSQKVEYNAIFTGLVTTIWFQYDQRSSSKLAANLQGLLQDMRGKYKDENLSFEERTKFAYLYFLNFATVEALKGTSDVIEHTTTPSTNYMPTNGGLTFIEKYITLNGVEYSLRHGNIFYVFSRGNSTEANIARRARSLDNLINYMEYQNRVVVRAPNGKYFAIRKHNHVFKINRSNGTIIPQDFNSFESAKHMLTTCAVDGDVPIADRAICGFNTYGKR